MSDDFKPWEYMGLNHPLCPSCGEEVPDIHNGGDPAAWWHSENIPDGNVKHKCHSCNQEFRVEISWSPTFAVIPKEHDHEFEDDYSTLDWA